MRGVDLFAQKRGWLRWRKTGARVLTCPACQQSNAMTSRLDTASPVHKFHRFALFECPACGTGHFPELRPPAYEDKGGKEGPLKFYIEQGAGLLSMIQPLMALPQYPNGSILEVGCGYGFCLHFSREALQWNSTGFDPSSLARAGAKDLGIPIRSVYLNAETARNNGPFDIVYSSEVIEHVVDPDQFLGPITDVLT
ncbi:hypothetical protein MNBD_ALPHA06-1943, partial [hydrothermal vent metagenome]